MNKATPEQMAKVIAREKLCRQLAQTQSGGFKANYTKEANRLSKWIEGQRRAT